jgi:hypothetical protein
MIIELTSSAPFIRCYKGTVQDIRLRAALDFHAAQHRTRSQRAINAHKRERAANETAGVRGAGMVH